MDTTPVDAGYHYDPGNDLWPVAFSVNATEASWTVNAPTGTECSLEGTLGYTFDIPQGSVSMGTELHGQASGAITITCTLGPFEVQSTASVL